MARRRGRGRGRRRRERGARLRGSMRRGRAVVGARPCVLLCRCSLFCVLYVYVRRKEKGEEKEKEGKKEKKEKYEIFSRLEIFQKIKDNL
jgi:hypothetical protein